MKIDFHNHYFPEEYVDYLAKRDPRVKVEEIGPGQRVVKLFGYDLPLLSPPEQIELMKELGVDRQILSLPIPNIFLGEAKVALESARLINDCFASLCRQYPERFLGFACIPLNAGKEGLKELERAIGDLGMQGVLLSTTVNGRPLDDPEFLPFLEEFDRLGLPVLLHPVPGEGAEGLYAEDYYLVILTGFPFETTLAATRLVFKGIFERFRRMKLILSHLGGALPYLMERIDYGYRTLEACRTSIQRLPSSYFKDFYYETALSYHLPALLCCYKSVGADHLLLGTDYPFVPLSLARQSISVIERMGLSAEEKMKIYQGNARQMLRDLGEGGNDAREDP